MSRVVILGAGLAGLIAACAFKEAEIWEAAQAPQQNHKALLRFRDKSVSTLTGIPFKEVHVRKAIIHENEEYDRCSIGYANMYALKVTGHLVGRSIFNLDPVTRYVAPDDFYNQLVERHDDRISWGTEISFMTRQDTGVKFVSTIPLPTMADACGLEVPEVAFEKKAVAVTRYKLPVGTDIYQTLYFPGEETNMYRASITGDVLIIESIGPLLEGHEDYAFDSFGIGSLQFSSVELDRVDQRYGKIVDLPREQREAILYELTRDFHVFSLGRFATWRNILLDDVVKDIDIVSRMINASAYGRERVLAART